MKKGFKTPLLISIVIHLVILAALSFSPLQAPKLLITQKLSTPIKSYVYQPPLVKKEVQIKTELQVQDEPDTVADLDKDNEVKQENKVNERTKENVEQASPPSTAEFAQQPTSQVSTPKPTTATAVFNPYKSRSNYGEKLQQQMLADFNQQQTKGRGFSAMQKLPAPVSPSVYHKTELQLNAEATTQIGNEIFVKRNGTCMQTTDLSNIDDNLGSVTSFSDCGETDDEKYFREFMKKKGR
ncbi:hypothetical protein A9Q98_12135 [Thalassotalea sp. 42_200_T64]|nr:hypothetical protein A9Q98_12135 [Thalassotalea sp. 42_200_T64]